MHEIVYSERSAGTGADGPSRPRYFRKHSVAGGRLQRFATLRIQALTKFHTGPLWEGLSHNRGSEDEGKIGDSAANRSIQRYSPS